MNQRRRDQNRIFVINRPRRRSSGTAARFQSVNADGWSATYASPPTFTPDVSPERFTVTRQGFSATGSATTYTEDLICTQRIRQAFPNQASLTADQVALSDYIYSTDTVTGATNNSTETSPKPIANWAMTDRRVIGNTLPKELLEVVAFHRNARNGEQVACVEWTISDGINPAIVVRSSASVVSGHSGDRQSVIVFRPSADVDILSLADQTNITVNCKVYPWVGGAASVANSVDSAVARELSPRTFRKWVARHSSPPLAYVATVAGGTPTVSTDPAVAQANPYGTLNAALDALRVFTSSQVDGCQVRLMAGTHTMSGSTGAGTYTVNAEVVVTRDPNVARADAIFSWGTGSTVATRCSWFRWFDISMTRTGTFSVSGLAGGHVVMESVNFNAGAHSVTWINGFAGGSMIGVDLTNSAGAVLNAGTPENRLIRGLSGSVTTVEGWLVLGCNLNGAISFAQGSRSLSGSIVAYNRLQGNPLWGPAGAEAVTNAACVQNLFEYTSTTNSSQIRVSGDSAAGNTNHIVVHHNTLTGFDEIGRSNIFYDEGATPRNHKLMSCVGNIHCSVNNKGDVFQADGTRTGNWPYMFGVGCRSEFTQFIAANGGGFGDSFSQVYPGPLANYGTSNTTRNDPLFTNYQGTISGSSAGAGGGTYTIGGGSPCKARVTTPVLRFDLAGNARSSSAASSGAYE